MSVLIFYENIILDVRIEWLNVAYSDIKQIFI